MPRRPECIYFNQFGEHQRTQTLGKKALDLLAPTEEGALGAKATVPLLPADSEVWAH